VTREFIEVRTADLRELIEAARMLHDHLEYIGMTREEDEPMQRLKAILDRFDGK